MRKTGCMYTPIRSSFLNHMHLSQKCQHKSVVYSSTWSSKEALPVCAFSYHICSPVEEQHENCFPSGRSRCIYAMWRGGEMYGCCISHIGTCTKKRVYNTHTISPYCYCLCYNGFLKLTCADCLQGCYCKCLSAKWQVHI